jgi:hypothetical protein
MTDSPLARIAEKSKRLKIKRDVAHLFPTQSDITHLPGRFQIEKLDR